MLKIIISRHARKRLAERSNVSPQKYQKFAEKAWRSKENPRYLKLKKHKRSDKTKLRFFMGYLFIFNLSDSKKTLLLVTVLNGKKLNFNRKKSFYFSGVSHNKVLRTVAKRQGLTRIKN